MLIKISKDSTSMLRVRKLLDDYKSNEMAIAARLGFKLMTPYTIQHPSGNSVAWFVFPDQMPTQSILNLKVKTVYPDFKEGFTELVFHNLDQVILVPEVIVSIIPDEVDLIIRGDHLLIQESGMTRVKEYLCMA